MKSSPKKQQKKPDEKKTAMPLGAVNYLMILLGVVLIAASYGIMLIEKNIDGVFALFVSPFTLIGSYVWIIFAVLYRPRTLKKETGQSS
ncbi:MAG: hypothetical protein HGB36_00850 [Chlorobiaceae bacterium]|jgi:hypothetical protein|nr:hypothetical protein [Chlorobiaceae bacterium]